MTARSRAEVAAELHAAIQAAASDPPSKGTKFRVQALRMLLTQYEDEVKS